MRQGIKPCLCSQQEKENEVKKNTYNKLLIGCAIVLVILAITIGVSIFIILSIQEQNDQNIQKIENYKMELAQLNSSMNYFTNFYNSRELIYPNPIHEDDFIKFTSPFGKRNNPLQESMGGSDTKIHYAIDLTGREINAEGTWMARVVPVADGIVTVHYPSRGYHKGVWYQGHEDYDGYIIVKHFDGRESKYGHLGETYVREGQTVKAGETILGRISPHAIGKSTGPHLHFELLDESGRHLQPLKYIRC